MPLPRLFILLPALLFSGAPLHAMEPERLEYDITWVGISIGTMVVQNELDAAGQPARLLRMWNRPWIARFYPVETTIECRILPGPDGPCHAVYKHVRENNFRQDDTLLLWPTQGRAVWSNQLTQTAVEFATPHGAHDVVTFFFDLRDQINAAPDPAGGDYELVMDDGVHGLTLRLGAAQRIRTPFGRVAAVQVKAISKSPTLFSRNRPKAVWVATSLPVVLFADVDSRFGAVRATLTQWTRGNKPVQAE